MAQLGCVSSVCQWANWQSGFRVWVSEVSPVVQALNSGVTLDVNLVLRSVVELRREFLCDVRDNLIDC